MLTQKGKTKEGIPHIKDMGNESNATEKTMILHSVTDKH